MEWDNNDFRVSTDQNRIDLGLVHSELTRSYWSEGIPFHIVKKSIQNSLCFGLYQISTGRQVGFARVVSDFSTFAYLGDVFVVSEFKGLGLSKFMMNCIVTHPELQGLRRFCLGTRDAHGLYEKYEFEVIKEPRNWMEIKRPDIYKQKPIVSQSAKKLGS